MANKKNYTVPTDAFISTPEETPEAQSIEDIKIPAGYKIVRESRSKRLQLLITPTTEADLKTAAKIKGISLNELCNNIFDEFLREGK